MNEIKEQLSKRYHKIINYLIENYNNPKKTNSNLDLTWESIHELDTLIHILQCYRTDINAFKDIIEDLAIEQSKSQENNLEK